MYDYIYSISAYNAVTGFFGNSNPTMLNSPRPKRMKPMEMPVIIYREPTWLELKIKGWKIEARLAIENTKNDLKDKSLAMLSRLIHSSIRGLGRITMRIIIAIRRK